MTMQFWSKNRIAFVWTPYPAGNTPFRFSFSIRFKS